MDNKEQELLAAINDRLIRMEKKQALGRKIALGLLCALLLIVIITLIVVIPKVNAIITQCNDILTETEGLLSQIDPADVESVAQKLEILAQINPDKLQLLVDAIDQVDVEGLSTAFERIQSFLKYFK